MENEFQESSDFRFLNEESVRKHFADLNIKLLSGRHIQTSEYNIFSLLEDYYEELKEFYAQLYKLNLVRKIFNNANYYYLDFFDAGKGKLTDPSRYRALTELQTITGLMMLDMFYLKYFDPQKTITWSDIRHEIEDGDHKIQFQRMLFPDIRSGYTEPEWQSAERKFKAAIHNFNELGWVTLMSGQQEELRFEINPSIHRMAELYEAELADIDAFSLRIKPHEEI